MEKADAGVAQILVNNFRIEKSYCVDYIQRRPANEEFEHDDKQHFYHAFLVQQTLFRIGPVIINYKKKEEKRKVCMSFFKNQLFTSGRLLLNICSDIFCLLLLL